MKRLKDNNIDIELSKIYGKSLNPNYTHSFPYKDDIEDFCCLIEYINNR